MTIDNVVLVHQFCIYHQVEMSFIDSLDEYGLISIKVINEDKYLLMEDLKAIEKMAQFYYDLGINLEGIDVITNLLIQNDHLRKELEVSHKKLSLFGDDVVGK